VTSDGTFIRQSQYLSISAGFEPVRPITVTPSFLASSVA